MADHIVITKTAQRYRVRAGDTVLGETGHALLLTEGGRGPVIYVPRGDMDMALMVPTSRQTTCPWKGEASYFSVKTPGGVLDNVIWSYETPKADAAAIAGHLAFYPAVTVEAV
jgi:uncharacterized protein (DUF427 family)